MRDPGLEGFIPGLASVEYQVTSPEDGLYNCIAWAAGRMNGWWWPDAGHRAYWPPTAPRELTVAAFVRAFETLGYQVCSSDEWEHGFEKVALYARDGKPTHMARQVDASRWTSKCGSLQDINHTLDGLEGPQYGEVVVVLKRQRR